MMTIAMTPLPMDKNLTRRLLAPEDGKAVSPAGGREALVVFSAIVASALDIEWRKGRPVDN